jgi:hypothetical protein
MVNMPLGILVGAMGAGKSTLIHNLRQAGLSFTLLPNRRELTERLVVAPLQREDGITPHKLDRLARLPYIHRYHQRQPAGLGHAITLLSVDPAQVQPQGSPLLLFDGLRGAEEVRYAFKHLPRAFFIGLYATDYVRLSRLLERHDAYDHISAGSTSAPLQEQIDRLTDLGVPLAGALFTSSEVQTLLESMQRGIIHAEEVRDRLTLLSAERELYDLNATFSLLQALGKKRAAVIDTTLLTPAQVAEAGLEFIRSISSQQ